MTNEIDIVELALTEYKQAMKIKEINKKLYENLVGSIHYLISYSEKYNVTLPKRDELMRMIENTNLLVEDSFQASQTMNIIDFLSTTTKHEEINRKFTERRSTTDLTVPV